jgi:ribonuclease HI
VKITNIIIYTDGSCIHYANQTGSAEGPGGYAAAIYINNSSQPYKVLSGGNIKTTNNRMEIAAVIEAIRYLYLNEIINKTDNVPITIYSDSQYVINSINTWRHGWAQKQFNGIKNPDLWKHLHELLINKTVNGVWVKGHNGNPENEMVNTLAQQEAYKLKG